MSLLNPLGLLGLLSILALILIYILKPKYQEKKTSSTLIWKLSLNYKKRKLPLQWLQKSLIFFVQVLILILLTTMWARPAMFFGIKNGEKVVILDASASMQTLNSDGTRFERAINDIKNLAQNKGQENKFTVILAAGEASYVVRRTLSVTEITSALDQLSCTFEEANIDAAVKLANTVLDENVDAEVILYTDKNYKETGYITLKNYNSSEWNAAILNFTDQLIDGYHVFTAEVASYGKNEYIPIELIVDGIKQTTKIASCSNSQTVVITWEDIEFLSFKNAEVKLNVVDDFNYDNQSFIFGGDREELKVQLVSPSPIFLFSMLRPLGCKIDVHYTYDADNFDKIQYSGYDLYIFDGFEMTSWPSDGAVWIINPLTNIPVESGLQIGSTYNGDFEVENSSTNTSETFLKLTKDFNPGEVELTRYTKITNYDGYEEILTVDNDPLVLTKNINGVKVTVLAFDIGYSNLPVLFVSYAVLVRNMKQYSIAHTTEELVYNTGTTININGKANTNNITIEHHKSISEYEDQTVELKLDQPGVYEVTQKLSTGEEIADKFYVRVAENDSNFSLVGGTLAGPEYINLEKGITGRSKQNAQEIITYLAATLLALIAIEWGLQHRELF